MANEPMKPNKADGNDTPDIRESKRRLSFWAEESDPQMHRIHAINAKAHARWKAHRGRR